MIPSEVDPELILQLEAAELEAAAAKSIAAAELEAAAAKSIAESLSKLMISDAAGERSAAPALEEGSIDLISYPVEESSAGPALEEESRMISESAPKSQLFISKRKQKLKTNEPTVLEKKRRMLLDVKAKSKDCKTNVFLKHIPRNIIIAFVEAIEKGHYYFHFKDYLNKCDFIKHDSDPNHVYDILFKMSELDIMFKKVGKAELLIAIEEHIFKVRANRSDYMRNNYADYLPKCKFITFRSDFYENLEQINREGLFDELTSDDKERGLKLYKRYLYFHHPTEENPVPHKFYCIGFHMKDLEDKEKEAAPTDPLYKLIFQIHRGKHNMHLNPEVELKKLRRSNPSFYHSYFVDWTPQRAYEYVPSRRVMISDVPFGASVQDMKNLFSSCGEIDHVNIYRGDRKNKSHDVLITFKESAGAERAVLLSDKEMTIRGTKKAITVELTSRVLVATYEYPEPNDVIAARGLVSSLENAEDVGSVLAQVLDKYWYYSQNMSSLVEYSKSSL